MLPVATVTHFALGHIVPVTLASGTTATVSLRWSNWCGARPQTLSLVYALPAGGGGYVLPLRSATGSSGPPLPHCDNPVLPSHLDVGLFQHA